MKLTEKQQQIVDSLIEEFAEINKVEADKADSDFDGWNDPQDEVINWRKGFEPIFKAAAAETRSKVRAFLESQRKDIAGYIVAAGKHSSKWNFSITNAKGAVYDGASFFIEDGFPDNEWNEIVEVACDRAVTRLASNDGYFTLFEITFQYRENGRHKLECVLLGADINADYERQLKSAPIEKIQKPSHLRDVTNIYFELNRNKYNTPKEAYNNDRDLRVAISNVVMDTLFNNK